VLLIFSIMHSV